MLKAGLRGFRYRVSVLRKRNRALTPAPCLKFQQGAESWVTWGHRPFVKPIFPIRVFRDRSFWKLIFLVQYLLHEDPRVPHVPHAFVSMFPFDNKVTLEIRFLQNCEKAGPIDFA